MTVLEIKTKIGELGRHSSDDPSGVLDRALRSGLVERLTNQLISERSVAEYFAWREAIVCGSVELLNESITIEGYDSARKSVDAYLVPRLEKAKNELQIERLVNLICDGGTYDLSSGLLANWLPLGLWALTEGDAIHLLRHHTKQAHLFKDKDRANHEYFQERSPDLYEAYLKSPLLSLDGNPVFASARRLQLYHANPAPAKLMVKSGVVKFVLKSGHEGEGMF